MVFKNLQLLQGEILLGTLRWYSTDQPWFNCHFEPESQFAPFKDLFEREAQASNVGDVDAAFPLQDEIDALGLQLKDKETGQELTDFLLHVEGEEATFRY